MPLVTDPTARPASRAVRHFAAHTARPFAASAQPDVPADLQAYDRIAALSAVPMQKAPVDTAGKGGGMTSQLAFLSQWSDLALAYVQQFWRQIGLIAGLVLLAGLLFWRLGERSRHAEQELMLDYAAPDGESEDGGEVAADEADRVDEVAEIVEAAPEADLVQSWVGGLPHEAMQAEEDYPAELASVRPTLPVHQELLLADEHVVAASVASTVADTVPGRQFSSLHDALAAMKAEREPPVEA